MNFKKVFTVSLVSICSLANFSIMVIALFYTIGNISVMLPDASVWNYLLATLIGFPMWAGLTILGKLIVMKPCEWIGNTFGIKITHPIFNKQNEK